MRELIEKLEKAAEGSRGLDVEIARACGDERIAAVDADPTVTARSANVTGLHWEAPNCVGNVPVPNYTTSIDAALTLVPEGWRWTVTQDRADVYPYDPDGGTVRLFEGSAPTPALALCIAALRARLAGEPK